MLYTLTCRQTLLLLIRKYIHTIAGKYPSVTCKICLTPSPTGRHYYRPVKMANSIPLINVKMANSIPLINVKMANSIPLINLKMANSIPLINVKMANSIPLINLKMANSIPLINECSLTQLEIFYNFKIFPMHITNSIIICSTV